MNARFNSTNLCPCETITEWPFGISKYECWVSYNDNYYIKLYRSQLMSSTAWIVVETVMVLNWIRNQCVGNCTVHVGLCTQEKTTHSYTVWSSIVHRRRQTQPNTIKTNWFLWQYNSERWICVSTVPIIILTYLFHFAIDHFNRTHVCHKYIIFAFSAKLEIVQKSIWKRFKLAVISLSRSFKCTFHTSERKSINLCIRNSM